MIKTIVQMIFEQHATDSLRKTLAEVERAAAGKLHNESLSDYITRLASLRYDAKRTNRELDAYREENQRHYAISAENGRVDEEPVEDYMVRVWDSRQVAQRFAEEMKTKLQAEEGRYSKLLSETTDKLLASAVRIDSLEKKLDDVRRCARKHGWNEPYGMTDDASLCDSLKTALDVSQPGIAALRAQVEDLKAGEAESKAAAEEYGVLPDETHAQFIKRVLGDLATAKEEARRERERANHINAEAEENMKKLWSCADKLGRRDYEPLSNFMERQAVDVAEQTRRTSRVGERLDLFRQDAQDKGQELLKVRAWHEEKLQKIRELEEDSTRKDQTVARLQKVLTAIHGAAKAGGLKQGEKIGAFIERLNEDLYKVRCDATSESMKIGNANKQLERSYDESRLWSAEELKTARAESLKARTDLSEIAKIVNPEGENGPVIDFVVTMANRLGVSHKLHSAAVEERNNAQEEVRKLSDELAAVTADRDRIRAELAPILAEANKSGRCSGDPVALIRQGQADLDALIRLKREKANVDEEALQLQAEIDNEKADIVVLERQLDSSAQRAAKTADEYAALQDRASQTANELSEAQLRAARLSSDLEAILKTANDRGRAIGESVSSFIDRLVVNNAELRKSRDGYQLVELELRKVQALMVRIEANTARAGRADGEDLVDFIWRQHYEKGLAREQSAKEVARLSELVAGLQVELDEARGKYSDIVAALENKTLQQLIKRTDRSAKEQNASLSAQLERLQKMFRQEMKDHQEAREAITSAHSAASGCGMRDVESLPAFINRQFGELSEARNAALECGMLPEDSLRSFICQSRRKLVDAMEAGDRLGKLASENSTKLDAALKTVEKQSAAIAEAKQATEKYTEVVQTAAKLRDWASTIRHKVLVPMVHTKAMDEYDNIMKELDGKAGTDGR